MSWNFDEPLGEDRGPQSPGVTRAGPEFTTPPGLDWPEMPGGSSESQNDNAPPWQLDGGGDPNGAPLSMRALPTGKPPTAWIVAAAACAGVALIGGLAAVFVLDRSLVVAAMCWLLAGPVAVLVLGQFVRLDERQRARAFYEGDWSRPASIAVGVATLLAVAVSAYVIADWAASR